MFTLIFTKREFWELILFWDGLWTLSKNICIIFLENLTIISSVCKKYGRRLKTRVNSTILTKLVRIEEEEWYI